MFDSLPLCDRNVIMVVVVSNLDIHLQKNDTSPFSHTFVLMDSIRTDVSSVYPYKLL